MNTGSSSLKLRVVGEDDSVLASVDVERWVGEDFDSVEAAVGKVSGEGNFLAVGHRVVHGGSRYRDATRLDPAVIDELEALTPLAPVHQPRAIAAIRHVAEVLPDVPWFACFDTAFHATLPAAASTYALPAPWRSRWDLRRFGFHGLSHAWAARTAARLLGREGDEALRVVTCHLGAGSSLCAVRGGRSVDTTMGFTPLEGLVMATRSGTVDPGLVLWLVTDGGLSPSEVTDGLEHQAGLAGLAGVAGGDLRDVVAAADGGHADASLAVEVWVHRLRQEIGAMVASLDGIDALVFTGGIGEHQPPLRATAVAGLSYLGLSIDAARNDAASADAIVSPPGAWPAVVVVAAREDAEIARQMRGAMAR